MLSQIRLLVIVFFSLILLSGAFGQFNSWQSEKNMLASKATFTSLVEEKPGVYSSYKVDVPPRILNYDEVRNFMGYPEIAKNAGIQGRVVLKVLVNKNGQYVKHEVEEDFHPLLRIAAESFAPYLKFEPANHDQKNVACWMSIPFDFKLPAYGK
ncbi:MAG: energy transducer TonB [Bacteroidia bacterium]|nr:energy transducer TonB [Bacteroidia bacterium]